MSDESPPLKHYVYERLRTMIDSGLSTKKEVFDAISSELAGSPELAPESGKLRGYAAKRWTQREAEERTWTERTMNDNLDAAFAALNAAGVVALQNAGWTNTTGWEDSWAQHEARKASGAPPRGAVFYHYQALERAVSGGALSLNFGVFHEQDDGDLDGNARLAAEICAVLRAHGLEVRWDGDPRVKIEVQPFPWRRRRFTTAPPAPGPWRRFRHGDGRAWALRLCGDSVELRITVAPDADDAAAAPPIERRRKYATPGAAAQAAEGLIREQQADGFTEDLATP